VSVGIAQRLRSRIRETLTLRELRAGAARGGGARDARFRTAMSNQIEITFRGIERSEHVERFVRDWSAKLDQTYDRIERCTVIIDSPHQHHRNGRRFQVRIVLAIPGDDVVVSRDPGIDGAHEDVYVAVRDAFRAARRQLQDRVRQMRDVYGHASLPV
jgi:hypothetical protein